MEQVHRTLLRVNRLALISNLICDEDFMLQMQQEGMLTPYLVEELRVLQNRFDRSRRFIDMIQRRGPKAYTSFLKAVIHTKQSEVYVILVPGLM